jgi:hypothetical protein
MLRLAALLCLLTAPAAAGGDLVGLWLTQGKDGVMAVAPCGEALCVRIAGVILDRADDPTPVDHRGVSQCHLPLVTDARLVEPGLWAGHITDPRNGRVYGVELRSGEQGELLLRGFLGIPLLGRTQTWTRFEGAVPDDCRMTAPHPMATGSRPRAAG